MNRKLHTNARRLGLAALIGTTGALLLTLATPAEAGPRDRRGPQAPHAERGHNDPHQRGHVDRDRRVDRRENRRIVPRVDRRTDRRIQRRMDRRSADLRWDRRVARRDRLFRRHHQRWSGFEAPRRLTASFVHDYRGHHRGRLYSRAHRHYHEVYYFPVLTRWGWEPRPHYYCGGSLFGGGYVAVHGRNFGIGLHF